MNKNNKLRIAIFTLMILIFTLLSGCLSIFKSPTCQISNTVIQSFPSQLENTETLVKSEEPTLDLNVQNTESPNLLTKYKFHVNIVYDLHFAEVNEIIEYQNKTDERLSMIQINIPPD